MTSTIFEPPQERKNKEKKKKREEEYMVQVQRNYYHFLEKIANKPAKDLTKILAIMRLK